MTGGTLTLTDTSSSLTANIQMTGLYSSSSFTLAHDSGTGTLVKFAAAAGMAIRVRETRHEHIEMDGRQIRLGRRGQLEPGWRTGRKLRRRDNHRSAGRLGLDRDGVFDHRFVRPRLRVGGKINKVTSSLNNTGHLYVEGGNYFNIGGKLTDSGYLSMATTPRLRRRTR